MSGNYPGVEEFGVGAFSSVGSRRMPMGRDSRRCRFERMESRRMLTADLGVGAAAPVLGLPGGADGSIAGSVFVESESGAVGLANVRMQLLNEMGAVIEEQLTDEQGAYQFSGLLPGIYAVQEVTPEGYTDLLSQAGSGGGMALNANLFGEIVVEAGASLRGYNFFDSLIVTGQSGEGEQRIDAFDEGVAASGIVPIVGLSLQMAVENVAEASFEVDAFVEVAESGQSFITTTLAASGVASFGNADRAVRGRLPEQAVEESPFDNLFSLPGVFELASANLPSVEVLGQLFDEVGAELGQFWSEVQSSGDQSAAATAAYEAEPRLARREEMPVRTRSESGNSGSEEQLPTRAEGAEHGHAEAVDEIFSVEDRVDYRAAERSEPVAEESEASRRQAS